MNSKKIERGFTLLEISLALLLIGLLTAGGFKITSALRHVDKKAETQAQIFEIKQGLLTYLKVNKFLPCPDTDGDGEENRDLDSVSGVSACHSRYGQLPSQTLSVSSEDAWGSPFYYRVNQRSEQKKYVNDICQTASVFGISGARTKPSAAALCPDNGVFYCAKCGNVCASNCDFNADPRSADSPPYFNLHTPPKGAENADGYKNMVVIDENSNEVENAIIAMVVSFGSNGTHQTWSDDCQQAQVKDSRERENCNNDSVFQINNSVAMDDYLTWITLHDVKQAMIDIKGF